MSSNNQLIILKKKDEFQIHHHLCVDNDFTPSEDSLLGSEDTLELAIKFANEYCQKEIVEYGTYVSPSCYRGAEKTKPKKSKIKWWGRSY